VCVGGGSVCGGVLKCVCLVRVVRPRPRLKVLWVNRCGDAGLLWGRRSNPLEENRTTKTHNYKETQHNDKDSQLQILTSTKTHNYKDSQLQRDTTQRQRLTTTKRHNHKDSQHNHKDTQHNHKDSQHNHKDSQHNHKDSQHNHKDSHVF